MKIKSFIAKNKVGLCVEILALLFSSWLMFSTFSDNNGSLLIASKAWSDFASHIPLIRSFSFGNNFPPQYPLFPGAPIRYHFIFFLLVGMLEKLGLRIDWSLNTLSVVSFLGLLTMIYFFAKTIFKNRAVGIISIVLFLFNGSLSFLDFFNQHPVSIHTLNDIVTNKTFPSFGPYDGKIVSAFWNLNIYTNQRHLAGAFALCLFAVYMYLIPVLKNKKATLTRSMWIGVILGLSFYFHTAVYLMTIIIFSGIFLLFKKLRFSTAILLGIALLIGLPQYVYLNSVPSPFKISFVPGYLIANHLTFLSFVTYWFMNLGLYVFLIPAGFFLADKNARKIFLCFIPVFLVGNLFQFTPDMATNHKFFNLFIIASAMFSANALITLWKKNMVQKCGVVILTFFLILSGIIDFFPIKNDYKIGLADYPKNKDIQWIIKNTQPDSIFLDSQVLYTPESLAGRKLLLGWPYFPWSAGYDTTKRTLDRSRLLDPQDKDEFCRLAKAYHISYVELHEDNKQVDDLNSFINKAFFERFLDKVYENKTSQVIIYSVSECDRI